MHDTCIPFPAFPNQLLIDSRYWSARNFIANSMMINAVESSNLSRMNCFAISWLTVVRICAFHWRILCADWVASQSESFLSFYVIFWAMVNKFLTLTKVCNRGITLKTCFIMFFLTGWFVRRLFFIRQCIFNAVVSNTLTTIDAALSTIVAFQVSSKFCQFLHQIITVFVFQCFADLNKPVRTIWSNIIQACQAFPLWCRAIIQNIPKCTLRRTSILLRVALHFTCTKIQTNCFRLMYRWSFQQPLAFLFFDQLKSWQFLYHLPHLAQHHHTVRNPRSGLFVHLSISSNLFEQSFPGSADASGTALAACYLALLILFNVIPSNISTSSFCL